MPRAPSSTVISARLPSPAPSSLANALGTRKARLLPHFKNSVFILLLSKLSVYNVDTRGRLSTLRFAGQAPSAERSRKGRNTVKTAADPMRYIAEAQPPRETSGSSSERRRHRHQTPHRPHRSHR